jgi:hypothetical protein
MAREDGETPTSAVVDRCTDRTVIHDGILVGDQCALVWEGRTVCETVASMAPLVR